MGGIAKTTEGGESQNQQQLETMQRFYEFLKEKERIGRIPEIVRTYLDAVRPFYGETNDLLRFINAIEKVIPTMMQLEELEKTLRFEQIICKLEKRAQCIYKRRIQKRGMT